MSVCLYGWRKRACVASSVNESADGRRRGHPATRNAALGSGFPFGGDGARELVAGGGDHTFGSAAHAGEEGLGLADGFFHVGDEAGDIGLEGAGGAGEAGDGLGVEVGLQEENFVAKLDEDGVHAVGGGVHGADEAVGAGARLAQEAFAFAAVGGVVDEGGLDGPFAEEGLGDVLDGLDAGAHGLGAGLAGFELGVERVVESLDLARLDGGEGEELFERGLELFLGLGLGVAGVLDARDEDVAFGVAEFLGGLVVGVRAAGEQGDGEEEDGGKGGGKGAHGKGRG